MNDITERILTRITARLIEYRLPPPPDPGRPLHGPIWHRADGSLWSTDVVDAYSAYKSLWDPEAPCFFLREVLPNPKRHWWTPWRPQWVYGERTWKGRNPLDDGFSLIRRDET